MAQRARFKANRKGIGKILTSRQMQAEMERRARAVQDRCIANAPEDTGSYKSSFRVETGIRPGPKPRAVSKVVNDDEAAPYVEWGSSRTPRYRVMGRAAGAE
ncbi:hypothetical protein ABZ917_17310 [Nonomuraea wenchangensis]